MNTDRTYQIDELASLEGVCIRGGALLLCGDVMRDELYISGGGAAAFLQCRDISSSLMRAGIDAALMWGTEISGSKTASCAEELYQTFIDILPDTLYTIRIIPVSAEKNRIIADILILNSRGEICMSLAGFGMNAESGSENSTVETGLSYFKNIKSKVESISIVELGTVAPFAQKSFSGYELEKYQRMGVKRKKSFAAGRLACRSANRKISGMEKINPRPEDISIVSDKNGRPEILYQNRSIGRNCSISHDNRFAVAVISRNRIGIDVERISGKALKSRTLYMSQPEIDLADNSGLSNIEASMRIWSVKEAASKASGFELTKTWNNCIVTDFDGDATIFNLNGKRFRAVHDIIDGHLFTVVVL